MGRGGASGLLARPDQAAARAGGLARAEVFRRNLQKRPDYNPAMSEQKEALRKAEASLQDAEKRLVMVRKWQPALRHAVLEYHASVQRLKDLAAGDVPSAVNLLTRGSSTPSRLISGWRRRPAWACRRPTSPAVAAATTTAAAQFTSIATTVLDEDAGRRRWPKPRRPRPKPETR